MNADDLKHLQDTFVDGARDLLREHGRLRPIGFVVTLEAHVAEARTRGVLDFIAANATLGVRDGVATIVLDLFMDPQKLYHAVLAAFPKTREFLPELLAIGQKAGVDYPYLRVIRPVMRHAGLEVKDIIAETMRYVCNELDAFACIMQSEAWLRVVDTQREKLADVPTRLGEDQKSTEVIVSMMETHDFSRMVTVPIHREAGKTRDTGKVTGFGEALADVETDVRKSGGRFSQFLKPLGVVS